MAARTLLEKFLDHWDPMFFGVSAMGVFCGVDAMSGIGGWVAVDGMVVLFCGEEADDIDETLPRGAAGHAAATISPFAWFSHDPEQTLYYECVAIGGGGVMSLNNPSVPVQADGDGAALSPPPASPRDLAALAVADGKTHLRWRHVRDSSYPATRKYRIYGDSGTGTMDWDTPIDEIDVAGPGDFSWLSSGFAHDTETQWAVRAVTAAGREDENDEVVSAVSVTTYPDEASVLSAEAGDDQ